MKKFIFGCVLLLAGVIGFDGWVIACTTGSGGGYSQALSYLDGTKDWVVALFFIGMFVIGFIIAFNEIKKDR